MQRQIGDLVQKQRASFGALDQAFLVGHGAREAAALVSEQLAFHQLGRNGAAVHGNERTIRARTAVMDESRNELLACPRLTVDVHRRLAPRHADDHVPQLLHDSRAADESRPLQVQGRGSIRTRTQTDSTADQLAEHAQVKRLGDEIEGAQFEGPDGGFDVAVGSDDGHGDTGMVFLNPRHEIEPVAVRQAHVREAQIELLGLQQSTRGADVRSGPRVEIHAAERKAHELEQVRLVIDDEYDRAG